MKRQIKNLTYTLLVAALFTGCTSESDPVTATAETDPNAISFTSYVGDMTRRTAETDEVPAALRTLQQDGFKVFANRTATDWTTNGASSKSDFMYDQTVVFNPDPQIKAWSYSPPKVWPKSDKVSFFAYSPYNSQASTFTPSAWSDAGATKLEYTHNNRIGSQDDLLAAASFDYTKDTHSGSVGFNFYHTLSKLRFAYSREAIAQTTTVEVSKLELQYVDGTIQNKRVLNLAGVGASMTADIWSSPATETNYTGDACQAGSVLNGESVLLIPQTYEDGELELVVSYKLTTNDPALPEPIVDEIVDRVIALPAVQGGLQPNKQYLYTLEIKPNAIQISSNITVGAWRDHIYYKDGCFHIISAQGLSIFSDIVNGTNKIKVDGYADGIPNSKSVNGILDNDIDLSTVCAPDTKNWTPIGNPSQRYEGTFDGNNHYVKKIYIDSTSSYAGLFGYTNLATIKNVKIRGAHLNGGLFVGALVGYMYMGSIVNCHFETDDTFTSSIQGGNYVGALCGDLYISSAEDCTVTVDKLLTVKSRNYYGGGMFGLVERPDAFAKNCFVNIKVNGTLNVTASGQRAGGFTGFINGTVLNCGVHSAHPTNAPVNISAGLRAGGFAGEICSTGKVIACYSVVTQVTGSSEIGYFVGFRNNTTPIISGCWGYSQNVPGTGHFSGDYSGTFSNCLSGNSPITDMSNLNTGINQYNTTAPADKQAKVFNVLDTYGPIVSTEIPD